MFPSLCHLAHKCGENTFRGFLEGRDADRRFVIYQLPELIALFGIPKFKK